MKKAAVISVLTLLTVLVGCQIEPPLKTADTLPIRFSLIEIETTIETVWDIDESWHDFWWYGWDEEDLRRFGILDYPAPSSYEVRFYYLGDNDIPADHPTFVSSDRISGSSFRRHMAVGWQDVLFWSDIDSEDESQVLIINEQDPLNIHATTSGLRLSYGAPSRSGVYNNPEVFYAGMPKSFYVSKDPKDYDYYDEVENVYGKHIDATLSPMVYIYLVQIVLYNNNNRITGMAERSAMTALADGVNLNTGHTHDTDVAVAYDMRFKRGVKARDNQNADIFGGKLTTFGLCDMESWVRSRTRSYAGSRSDLDNVVVANFSFNNNADSVYTFNVTNQLQKQSHGGIVTIEIDVDTLKMPHDGSHGISTGFDPWIAPRDSIEYDYML